MDWNSQNNKALVNAFLSLKNRSETECFLRDLLTKEEIGEFSRRLKAATMLSQKYPYSSITKTTGLSSTTVARVSRYLKRGNGGYKKVLSRLHHGRSLREETGGS